MPVATKPHHRRPSRRILAAVALPLLAALLLSAGAVAWTIRTHEKRLEARREALAVQRTAAANGEAAVARADCAAALPLLRRAANGPEPLVAARAASQHTECRTYEALRRGPAKPASRAALAYIEYLTTVADPSLRRAAAGAALATFRRTPESQLVATGTCLRRGDIQDHIVGREFMDRRMPLFLIGCARAAERAGNLREAGEHYHFAANNYSGGPHDDRVLAGWVRTELRIATKQKPRSLPLGRPERIDRALGGRARIIVANRADFWLRMGFLGRFPDMALVEPCRGCSPSDPEQELCDGDTPTETLVVPAGTYDVLVGFPTESNYPLVGRWTLRAGGVYTECFVGSGN